MEFKIDQQIVALLDVGVFVVGVECPRGDERWRGGGGGEGTQDGRWMIEVVRNGPTHGKKGEGEMCQSQGAGKREREGRAGVPTVVSQKSNTNMNLPIPREPHNTHKHSRRVARPWRFLPRSIPPFDVHQ